MNYIGNIIKEYRSILGMSRKNLAENICSEKYVYLIEKGERTPSADILRLFGDRLGADLFDHYQYLGCIDPIAVREIIKSFYMYRRKSDFDALQKVTNKAVKLPDFQHKPWIYEIQLNRAAHMVFSENKYEEAITYSQHMLQEIKPKYLKGAYVANLYMLLSTCYQVTGDLTNAQNATSSAYEILRDKHKIERYEQDITTVRINTVTLYYLAGKFEEVIREGNELLQYQYEVNSYERVHYTYFFLAFAYYKTGSYDEAIAWFKKGIYSVMLDHKPMDVYYITKQDVFDLLAKDARINQEIVCEFKKKYNISS